MTMNPRHELRDGVVYVRPPEAPPEPPKYRMIVRHKDGDAELDIVGERISRRAPDDAGALEYQREQWEGRGYKLVLLEPITTEPAA